MNDEEIRELVAKFGFVGDQADLAFRLCQDVERKTRQEFFSFIQHANNAAVSREISARQLDKLIWDFSKE